MADTIAETLIKLGFRASHDPYDRPNKPYHIKLGNSINPINRNHEDILFCVDVHNEKVQNAVVKHGYSIEVPLYAIDTIGKIEHFLIAVKSE